MSMKIPARIARRFKALRKRSSGSKRRLPRTAKESEFAGANVVMFVAHTSVYRLLRGRLQVLTSIPIAYALPLTFGEFWIFCLAAG